jgi:hypothetical protein
MATKKKCDWRSLPRKPAEETRSVKQGYSFTPAEIARLRANAAAANMTQVDWIVSRCCQLPT